MWCVMSFANIVSLQILWDTNYAQVWLLRKWGSESEVCCLKKGLEPAHGPSSCQHQHASSRYLYCVMPLSWKGQCHVGEVSGELELGRPSSISSLKSGTCYFLFLLLSFHTSNRESQRMMLSKIILKKLFIYLKKYFYWSRVALRHIGFCCTTKM